MIFRIDFLKTLVQKFLDFFRKFFALQKDMNFREEGLEIFVQKF